MFIAGDKNRQKDYNTLIISNIKQNISYNQTYLILSRLDPGKSTQKITAKEFKKANNPAQSWQIFKVNP